VGGDQGGDYRYTWAVQHPSDGGGAHRGRRGCACGGEVRTQMVMIPSQGTNSEDVWHSGAATALPGGGKDGSDPLRQKAATTSWLHAVVGSIWGCQNGGDKLFGGNGSDCCMFGGSQDDVLHIGEGNDSMGTPLPGRFGIMDWAAVMATTTL